MLRVLEDRRTLIGAETAHHPILMRNLRLAVATIFIAWTAFVIMRVPLLSHFRKIGGDSLDGMLALAIELHWSNVFNGSAIGWTTTNYFFPIGDTLGYNDGYFLHGTILALLRSFGIDPILGIQLVDWCYRTIGFVSMWALVQRCFNWPMFVNALAATLFVTANGYYLHDTGHAQLLTCYCLPILILLQIESFRAAASGAVAQFLALAAAFGVLLGALMITGFYMPYFFILTDLVALAFLFVFSRLAPAPPALLPALRRFSGLAAAQMAILLICLVPFFMIYGPKALETGMHGLADLAPWALRPTDIVNVGPYNLLWSHFYDRTLGHLMGNWQGSAEHQTGATPILFVLSLLGGLSLRSFATSCTRSTLLLAMWCASLLLLAVTIRWPVIGWPWAHLYPWVPGAAATRVVSRIQLVLLIPTVLLACNFMAERWRRWPEARPLLALLIALLLVEQVNDAPYFNIDRPVENAFLASVDRVPASCSEFFAENSRPGADVLTLYRHNVDSMIVAELSGTPTINGFATFLPPHWNLVHPEQPGYRQAVGDWLVQYPVPRHLCSINFQTAAWNESPSLDQSFLPALSR